MSPSLLLVTAEWDRRSHPSLTWAIVGGRGPQGPCNCPWVGRRPAPLNPSHWPHCCCLLSVGTLCPLCGLSLCTGRREVLPCLSQLTFCPSLPWLLAKSSQSFLPGLQNLVCEPVLWDVPGCHHYPPQLARMAGGLDDGNQPAGASLSVLRPAGTLGSAVPALIRGVGSSWSSPWVRGAGFRGHLPSPWLPD